MKSLTPKAQFLREFDSNHGSDTTCSISRVISLNPGLQLRSPPENRENFKPKHNQEVEKPRETIFGSSWNQTTVFGKHPASSPVLTLGERFRSGDDIRRTKPTTTDKQESELLTQIAPLVKKLHELTRTAFPNMAVPKAHLDLISVSESLDRFVWIYKLLINNLNKFDSKVTFDRQNNLIQKYKEALEKRDQEIASERESSILVANQLAQAQKKLVEEGKRSTAEIKKMRAKLDEQQQVICQLAKEILDLKHKSVSRDVTTPRDPKRQIQFDKTSTEELMQSSRNINSLPSTARNISPICGEKEPVRDTEVREAGVFADICSDFLITFKEQHRSTSRTV